MTRHLKREHDANKFASFNVEYILANEHAIQHNVRYQDVDLNRCFLYEDLRKKPEDKYERIRAAELDCLMGPKQPGVDPKMDVIIDLHTTSANTGLALMMAPDDVFAHALGKVLRDNDPDVRIVNWAVAPDWSMLPSVARSGFTFEVGPCSWGCLASSIYRKTLRLVHLALEFIQAHNERISCGISIENISIPCFRKAAIVDYPRFPDKSLKAMIHPNFEGRDLHELKDGDNVFLLFDGVTEIPFKRADVGLGDMTEALYPLFINEAAYYEKGIAFMLMTLEERTLAIAS
eukprot:GEMP01074762.1.p1 GENE.GEMP01074762.1~~GEMP01074762.1.p1  ORF type:complete len:290 (+),score=48.27 GEMP01074762.1:159-1028(+)